jgi:tetratricopeptide (TPR) repeat protein/tRNA A-37 threonylcarbamoyl transferase component Bud32
LPREAWARLERVLERFEDDWRGGGRPNLDAYLAEVGPGERQALLIELIHTDLHYRLEAGELARVEDYLARYPDLAGEWPVALDLIAAEYQLRRKREPGLAAREYLRRFPQYAEALQIRLEPAGEDGRVCSGTAARRAKTPIDPDREAPLGSHREPAPADARIPQPGDATDPAPAEAGLSALPGYEILGELGRGGMGVVLHGRDPDLCRDLAVKVLHPDHQGDPDLLRRFLEEAQIAGQLQHPGVAPVYARGRFPDGRPFFTMKLVQGQTLAELLAARSDPAHELPRFLGIFETVCQTLGYAHNQGVIHRDLKPANVMVGNFGEVQVMDWGLAKVLPADRQAGQQPRTEAGDAASAVRTLRTALPGLSSQEGAVLGTLAYMAPEQASGQVDRLDERSDVFGLGAILCEILTGQPPYAGASGEIQLQAVAGDLAGAWSELDRCGADPDLVRLAKTCLAPRPEDRPANGGEVAKAVGGYLAGVQQRLRAAEVERAAAQARAEEAQAKVAAERRARRRLLGLSAAVLLLVLLGGAGAWLLAEQRAAARLAAAQTLERGRLLLEEGWQRNDLGQLTEARSEADRAVELAGRVWAGQAVQQETARFRADADDRLERARKNRQLLDALLDISTPPETRRFQTDASGRMIALVRPSVDEQYAAAFRRWGLDVDETEEAEVIARLGQEPDVVVQEVIAGLDGWMVERWRQSRRAGWRHLYQIAERLDSQATRRQLRALLVEGAAPAPEAVAGLLSVGSAWPALWQLARGQTWRRVQELRGQLDLRQEPVLTVALLAQAYRTVGDAEGAVEVLREAAELRPNQLVLLRELARRLEEQQHQEEAIGCYRSIRGRRPELGIALALALVQVGRSGEGETVLRELLRQQPHHPDLHFYLGGVLNARGQAESAIEHYRQALQIDPRLARAHYNLGTILDGKGRADEAIEHYRQAIQLDPRLALPHYNLGNALYRKGRVDEAIEHYRQAIQCEPGMAGAHYNLGYALYGKGRVDEAIVYYRQAIRLDPRLAQAHYNLGLASRARGRLDEAIEHYRQAIRLDPGYARAHNNLGNALSGKGRLDEAIEHYREAIRLDPGYARAHNNLGTALDRKGQAEEAIVYYRQAIRLDPGYAQAHYNLGNALSDKGQVEQAIVYYRRAIQLEPRLAETHGVLGKALLRQGQFAQAREETRRCLDLLGPDHSLRPLVTRQLRQCEKLLELDEKLPAILEGKLQPADADWLTLAQLCQQDKQFYAASARFSAEAFKKHPKLADDLEQQPRYHAACAAALAGCGAGRDAGKLDEQERRKWRQQALDWLRDDLAGWGRMLGKGNAQTRARVQQRLRHWQTDADLAGVREPAALAKLPVEEREGWQKLWTDVEALRKRTEPKEESPPKD